MPLLKPLLFLLALLPTVLAAAEMCPPTSPQLRTGVDGEQLAAGYSRGILWRVERPGTAPSHILGTIHVADPRVADLSAPVSTALRDSRLLLPEVRLDRAAAMRYTEQMYLPEATGLRDLLELPLFNRVVQLLRLYGVPPTTANRLKPWAAFTLLARPPGEGVVLDILLQQLAVEHGIGMVGLESVDELVEALETIPLEGQVEILTDTVCNRELVQRQGREIVERYLARDLAGMMEVNWRYEPDNPQLFDAFMDAVLFQRNARMVERMEPHLEEGGVLVAVGALHLPGEEGILARLAARGFRLTPVY
jgi:uncharacterized protein